MTPDDKRHGTVAGYNAHRKHGIGPCDDCKRAMATYGARLAWDHMNGRPRKVDATGTARRVQALVTLGYTFGQIGDALGIAHDVARHLALHRKTVRVATAERVAELYEKWCMTPAPDSKGAKYARTTARKRGWLPPLAWDDIDNDPAPQPEAPRPHGRPMVRHIQIEDAEFLADMGENLTGVCARLKVRPDSLRNACVRAGRLDVYHRLADREPDREMRAAVRASKRVA